MKNEHKAYDIVDKIFLSFITNNKGNSWFFKMVIGDIVNIQDLYDDDGSVNALGILKHPWNIQYIAKSDGGEGPFYHFMDCGFNKVYSYYDVM